MNILYEAMQLNEMSMTRTDAIDRCISLGKQFITHFDKCYHNDNKDQIQHWLSEMQAWLNTMNEISIKPKRKLLTITQKIDWFYSFGYSYELFFSEDADEIEAYEEFIHNIEFDPDHSVKNAYEDIKRI